MAGGITIDQGLDLTKASMAYFEQDAVEMALARPTYEMVNRGFAADKKVLDGGKQVNWEISLKDTGNAGFTRLYDTDDPNVANVVLEGNAKWTHAKNSFSWDIREVAISEASRVRVFNLLRNRRLNCAREFADLLENAAWKTPEGSTDDLNPLGIFSWLVQADTSAVTGAFEGYVGDYAVPVTSAESAFATVGGLACTSTSNPKWANYYANHSNRLTDYLLKLMRRAFRQTNFQSPKIAGEVIDPKSGFNNFRFYTNSAVLDEFEELLTKSDDRIGADLGKYEGKAVFKGVPLIYISNLDTPLTYVYGKDPVLGVNHEHFYPIVLSGNNFKWSDPMKDKYQHNVVTVYLDLSFQYVCKNRRSGGFLISNWENAY